MEHLENGLAVLAGFLKLILEGVSVLCIFLGLLQALQQTLTATRQSRQLASSNNFVNLRMKFGAWLLLALEFQLAADIVNTTVAPSFEALGKLGIVAIVRTFLNYFLNRELAETMRINPEKFQSASDVGDRESI
ncbi:MAG TPA: DUF1622 domain-containing protein [Coleofasciculaceae cyanobacterium]